MILTTNQEELANRFGEIMGLGPPRWGMSFIGYATQGRIVVVNGYEKFNGASMYIHTASDGSSRVSRQFLWAAFDYPFNYCGAKMLIGSIASGNTKALKLAKHLGFKQAHVIQGAHPDGALVYMTMTREECRYITPKWRRTGT